MYETKHTLIYSIKQEIDRADLDDDYFKMFFLYKTLTLAQNIPDYYEPTENKEFEELYRECFDPITQEEFNACL